VIILSIDFIKINNMINIRISLQEVTKDSWLSSISDFTIRIKMFESFNEARKEGFIEVKELKDKTQHQNEGMDKGISARFVQNAFANVLVNGPGYVNAFMLLNEIKEKLKLLMTLDKNDSAYYDHCVDLVKKELAEILKNEVQKAVVADDQASERLFTNYIDNVVAFCEGAKITHPFTGEEVDPDEKLRRYKAACEGVSCNKIDGMDTIDQITGCMIKCQYSYDYIP